MKATCPKCQTDFNVSGYNQVTMVMWELIIALLGIGLGMMIATLIWIK